MTLKNQIMKLQTYKMYEGEDTVYVERDDVLKALEQQPCDDCISREEALNIIEKEKQDWGNTGVEAIDGCLEAISNLPSVTPQQTRWIPVSENGDEDNGKI